jgi:hypothetical protein
MKTTYEEIKSFNPCSDGWRKLLENTNPELDMAKEIDIMDIFKSNGIKDAIWALRCWDYLDWCLFICEVAESVLPIFEKKYPKDERPRKALQAIRDYKTGTISRQDLRAAAHACTACAACTAAYAAYAACTAACTAAYAACTADYAADAAAYAADAAARQKQWDKTEEIFIKHFGAKK